ncbi:hypothetical protein [Streptomyces sp. NBC_01443]|uniref:hypothetical protein n=1 Tax=Streptomyces sp. NBC_01443 TaxID=2903868 RepID=UPI00225510D1|nr:hypothetical protein [Streptomyces sp. NBC_01443]MCX4625468.1 hypothetical protein [Streptomyces sp. NBC_01443]
MAKHVEGEPTSWLPKSGQRVVLQTQHGESLELIARTTVQPPVNVEGAYLNEADWKKLSDRTQPTLRYYSGRDPLHKIFSVAGLILLLPTVLALATAVVGVFFVWNSQAQPTTTTIADKAQTVLAWAAEPADRLDTAALGSADIQQTHRELARRSRQAGWCLQAAQGRDAPPATIPGVTCSPAERDWWRDPIAGSLITGAIGILTAITGIAALRFRYGFQKTP